MKSIVFFNNKGGVGKTSLAYHFAYMLSELGYNTLAVDLDPQANLTSMLLDEDRIFDIYSKEDDRETIISCIKPLITAESDIIDAKIENINPNLNLICGDLELSSFEDKLGYNWGRCIDKDVAAFRFISAFYRIIHKAVDKLNAQYAVIDIGPNLGAINRVALISADYLIIPMAADLFSLQGMKNLGITVTDWKEQWIDRSNRNPAKDLNLPSGKLKPLGYVIMQHGIVESRPVKAYMKWAEKIPKAFRENILKNEMDASITIDNDIYCLAQIRHYHSLMPMAMTSKKPIFLLRPADGAIGAHFNAVKDVYNDFKKFTEKIVNLIENQ